jgi:hypothetical protein
LHLESCADIGMQVLDENSQVFYNFINSLHCDSTKESYRFCLEKFLNNYEMDLLSFLKLPQHEMDLLSFLKLPQHDMTNLIINIWLTKKFQGNTRTL